MRLAFVVYNGLTLLDFAGVFDPLTRLRTMGFVPNLEYDIYAREERVRSSEGASNTSPARSRAIGSSRMATRSPPEA